MTRSRAQERCRSVQIWLDRLAQVFAENGIHVVSYHGEGPTRFSDLAPRQQTRVQAHIRQYTEAALDVMEARGSLHNESAFLGEVLARAGVRPLASMNEALQSGDWIEVYDKSRHLVFRSLESFDSSGLTLEDVFTGTPGALFSLEEEVARRLESSIEGVLRGRIDYTCWLATGVHTADECTRQQPLRMALEHKIVSPLTGADGSVAGVMLTARCFHKRRLSPGKTRTKATPSVHAPAV